MHLSRFDVAVRIFTRKPRVRGSLLGRVSWDILLCCPGTISAPYRGSSPSRYQAGYHNRVKCAFWRPPRLRPLHIAGGHWPRDHGCRRLRESWNLWLFVAGVSEGQTTIHITNHGPSTLIVADTISGERRPPNMQATCSCIRAVAL